jgi:hypothetical protein
LALGSIPYAFLQYYHTRRLLLKKNYSTFTYFQREFQIALVSGGGLVYVTAGYVTAVAAGQSQQLYVL